MFSSSYKKKPQANSTTACSRQLHFHIGGLVPIMGPHTMNTAEVLHVSVVCHISKKRLYLGKSKSGKKKKNANKERPTVKTTVKYCAKQGPKTFVNSRNFHPLVVFEKSVGCNTAPGVSVHLWAVSSQMKNICSCLVKVGGGKKKKKENTKRHFCPCASERRTVKQEVGGVLGRVTYEDTSGITAAGCPSSLLSQV